MKKVAILVLMVLTLSGCTTTALNKQSLDQIDAAIESAKGFKLRAEAKEPVDPILIDIHLNNLNGLKENLKRALDE